MEWGPEGADALLTCASPHPVADPARPEAPTLTHYRKRGRVAYLSFICPAGRRQAPLQCVEKFNVNSASKLLIFSVLTIRI